MSSNDNDAGLMSSAGLVRYFDSEDSNAVFVDPRTVLALGLLFGVVFIIVNLLL